MVAIGNAFSRAARAASQWSGRSWFFFLILGLIIIWAAWGPFARFSDTWQLIINTGTTLLTTLLVILIQNSQNRDTAALHLKIDEVIRAINGARNSLMKIEDLSEDDLKLIRERMISGSEGRGNSRYGTEPDRVG